MNQNFNFFKFLFLKQEILFLPTKVSTCLLIYPSLCLSLLVFLYACLPVCSFFCLSVHLSAVQPFEPSIHLSILMSADCLSFCPYIHLSLCLFILLSVGPYVCHLVLQTINSSIYLDVYLTVSLSLHPSVCLSVCSFFCLSVHLSTFQSFKP
jgi:hypothetical protein